MGIDKVTKVLLAVVAAGIWTLVLLQVRASGTVNTLATEVQAIGLDVESIHEHLEAPESEEDGHVAHARPVPPSPANPTPQLGSAPRYDSLGRTMRAGLICIERSVSSGSVASTN